MDPIDLAIGNPAFLQTFWQDHHSYQETVSYQDMDYEREGGRESLKQAIRNLHAKVGNAITQDRHIVIGNGATQLLVATMQAMRVQYGQNAFRAQAPYYFRLPQLARSSGGEWRRSRGHEIVTLPGNPDNRRYEPLEAPQGTHRILDACYAWPTYDPCTVPVDDEAVVFSLAKATGHAASRIGWGIYKDADLAAKVAKYIEITTGGVSVEAQNRAEALLEDTYVSASDGWVMGTQPTLATSCFAEGRKVLEGRWQILNQLQHPRFKILNNYGMFGWCQLDHQVPLEGLDVVDYLQEYFGVKCVDGQFFGGVKGTFRLNFGCDEPTFQAFLKRVYR